MCPTFLYGIIILAFAIGIAFQLPFVLLEKKLLSPEHDISPLKLNPHSRSRDLIIFPVALLIAFSFAQCGGLCPIFRWLISAIFHELGHTLLFWMRGIVAVPWLLFTIPLGKSSIVTSLAVVAGSTWLCCFTQRRGQYILSAIAAIISAATIFFSFVLSESRGEMATWYAGLGGEIILAAAAMLLFFERFQRDRTKRYVFLVMGAISFSDAFTRWHVIRSGQKGLPLGAALDFKKIATGESGGDLDTLMRDFHWSASDVLQNYLATIWITAGVVVLFYSWQLFRTIMSARKS